VLGEPEKLLQLSAGMAPLLDCLLSASPPSQAVFAALSAWMCACESGDAAAAAAAAAALTPEEAHALAALQEACEQSDAAAAAAPLLSPTRIARDAAAASAAGAPPPASTETLDRLYHMGVSVSAHTTHHAAHRAS
jgi:hypothetical protein